MEVLGRLQDAHNVRDMQLDEISTEEVIKKIYDGGIDGAKKEVPGMGERSEKSH